MFVLEVVDGDSAPRFLRFEATPVTIGRDASMDVVLDDPTVSRQSAVIIQRGGRLFLQDLGGRNALCVNGNVLISHPLLHGDELSLGRFRITFQGDETGVKTPTGDDMIVDPRSSLREWLEMGAAIGPDTGAFASPRVDKVLDVLHGFSELIRQLPDREKLFDAALTPVFDLLEVKRSFIGLLNDDGILETVAERDAGDSGASGFSRSIVDRVCRDGVSILFSDENGPVSRQDSRSQVRLKIKSAMCVPIFADERVIGALYLDNRGAARSFTRRDLHFANILAHLISLALDKEELYRRVHEENLSLRSILRRKHRLVGVSPAVQELRRKIRRVASFDTTVLLLGESGTGKELVARAIHDRSSRKEQPFVAVNCAALPETLLESELFGYAEHSGISGADPRGKPGKFELAHEGTLFLDEIGDMSLTTQAKILRVLEERVVDRLGGREEIPIDIRIVAATNKELERAVARGEFREDLYYRLKVLNIVLPPLRERSEDILPIARYFLQQFGAGNPRGEPPTISPRAQELLLSYRWPGNIRELRNVIEQSSLLGNGRVIYPDDLPDELVRKENRRVFGSLAEVEARHLQRVLEGVNWNKRRASEILGINRSTLYEKIRVYEIERSRETQEKGRGAPRRV